MSDGGQTIYTVTARHQPQPVRRVPSPDRSQVLGVADAIKAGVSPEALLTAIETALELLGESEPPHASGFTATRP
jgi:hypothetical protein